MRRFRTVARIWDVELENMKAKEDTQSGEPGRIAVVDAVYEQFIFALTVYSLLVLVAYWLPTVSPATKQALLRSDILLSFIFLADSCRSLYRAPDKWAYLKWGWLDFLGSVPAVFPLRIARLARFFRAWRVIRTRHPRQVLQEFEQQRAGGVLLVTVFVAVILNSVTSIVVLELESNAPDANIRSGQDAFWWAFSTVTTVGYGDRVPVTFLGRIVAMVLMTVGIGLFGVLASFLAAAFVGTQTLRREDIDELREDLAEVKGELASIKAMLGERDSPREE